ncbi:MAG TPA: molecular chaperone HtpG, partial [Gammaproteobacteria bacterium]|nr:molecular chaperone HtpG [Gammaproteobacteria bacterium]
MSSAEKHVFQTEVQQLLNLMIHSLYSDKEIFLRELISNASDACDKLRFEALTNTALQAATEEELAIHITADKDKKTLTIRDNGIGMSREEVIENIGTIARSGSKAFIENMSKEQAKDVHFIGQFGVGFYSVFMVADQTTLLTRRAGTDEAVKWTSDGEGGYTLEDAKFEGHGVEITLKLREDAEEFLDTWRLRSIVSKYSDHISMPVYLPKEVDKKDEKDKKDVESKQDAPEWEAANKGSALWARPRREIKEDEYNSFYQSLSYDQEPPLKVIHNFVEGKQEYITLL